MIELQRVRDGLGIGITFDDMSDRDLAILSQHIDLVDGHRGFNAAARRKTHSDGQPHSRPRRTFGTRAGRQINQSEVIWAGTWPVWCTARLPCSRVRSQQSEKLMRVLLIEDDRATAQSIQLMLESEGFNVYTTDLGEEGVDLGKMYDYDLILLDLNLPDMSGLEVLRTLRVGKINTPVMILSGTSEIDTKVKTFSGGARVHLTGKEYQMLELLSLRKGITMTKEMLLNHLYGGMDEPEQKIIDVFICKVRKKLATATHGKHHIETVWGRGYVLTDPQQSDIAA